MMSSLSVGLPSYHLHHYSTTTTTTTTTTSTIYGFSSTGRRIACIACMRQIATDVARSVVCMFVCPLCTWVSYVKTDENRDAVKG